MKFVMYLIRCIMKEIQTNQSINACAHCGERCKSNDIQESGLYFCCEGCKTVYALLEEHDLCAYYSLEKPEIQSLKHLSHKKFERFAYLDDPKTTSELLDYHHEQLSRMTLVLPNIHCTSCVWLLEKLPFINPGIQHSTLELAGKRITILFDNTITSIREIVELLTILGYEPRITLATREKVSKDNSNRPYYIGLAIAGFAFGNIMLFSLPGYFDQGKDLMNSQFKHLFSALNILFSIPVIMYSAKPFFKSAFAGLTNKSMNLDIPIVIGVLAIYGRSLFEILSGIGPGFMDSFTGLIFFLLIGRLFQKKSFDALEFERDHASFIPLQCTVMKDGETISRSASSLQIGDKLLVRNQELIPTDSILLSSVGHVDYSFITGESTPVEIVRNGKIYAGAKVLGPAMEVQVEHEISRSSLLNLWNGIEPKTHSRLLSVSTRFASYFTGFTIILALIGGIYHHENINQALNVFTAVLIIACPCALTLAGPFTLGNIMRLSAKRGVYFKSPETVMELGAGTTIVFDKTGTLTSSLDGQVSYEGLELMEQDIEMIMSGCLASTHPKSRMIASWLAQKHGYMQLDGIRCDMFQEIPGKGWISRMRGHEIHLGSSSLVMNSEHEGVHVSIDGIYMGNFNIRIGPRPGILDMLKTLKQQVKICLLSGDDAKQEMQYTSIFDGNDEVHFNQSPIQKALFIQRLQERGEHTVMIGDGINDAGALKISQVGIAITERISSFTPGCDIIMSAESLPHFVAVKQYAKSGSHIIIGAFIISVMYNAIGLSMAFSGILTPLFTAILMPVSSLTVIGFSLGMTSWNARHIPFVESEQWK